MEKPHSAKSQANLHTNIEAVGYLFPYFSSRSSVSNQVRNPSTRMPSPANALRLSVSSGSSYSNMHACHSLVATNYSFLVVNLQLATLNNCWHCCGNGSFQGCCNVNSMPVDPILMLKNLQKLGHKVLNFMIVSDRPGSNGNCPEPFLRGLVHVELLVYCSSSPGVCRRNNSRASVPSYRFSKAFIIECHLYEQ